MPTYEYQCSACGHQLEEFQKMSEEPLKDCPECGKPTLSKLVSAAGFQLKGSGWYVTDYSAKGKAKADSKTSEASAAAKPASAETKTSEAKTPDTKSASTNSSSSSSSSSSSGAASV